MKIIDEIVGGIKMKIIDEIVGGISYIFSTITNTLRAVVYSIIVTFVWVSMSIMNFIRLAFSLLMNTINTFIKSTSKRILYLAPASIVNSVHRMLVLADFEDADAGAYISSVLFYSASAAVVATLFVLFFVSVPSFILPLVPIVFFGLGLFVAYSLLGIMIDSRTKAIDNVLPDVLQMVAQNLIAGMTPYNALWLSARNEFGPLAKEIQTAARDSLSGKTLAQSLEDMANRTDSIRLKRTVKLLNQGMKSGGNLSAVLQAVANDIRTEQNVEKQLVAETSGYAFFIMFALMVGAPLLFGVSHTFIYIFSNMLDKLNIGEVSKTLESAAAGGGGMSTLKIQKMAVTAEFFWWYTIAILVLSAVMTSLLVNLIRSGNIRGGAKFMIPFALIAVVVFMIIAWGLGGFFSGMVGS